MHSRCPRQPACRDSRGNRNYNKHVFLRRTIDRIGNIPYYRSVSPHCGQSRILFRNTPLVVVPPHRHRLYSRCLVDKNHIAERHCRSDRIFLTLVDTRNLRAETARAQGMVSKRSWPSGLRPYPRGIMLHENLHLWKISFHPPSTTTV